MCPSYPVNLRGSKFLCDWKMVKDRIEQKCNYTSHDPCELQTKSKDKSCLFEPNSTVLQCITKATIASKQLMTGICESVCTEESYCVHSIESEISEATYGSVILPILHAQNSQPVGHLRETENEYYLFFTNI